MHKSDNVLPDWVDMEQLMDYTSVIKDEMYILDKYNRLDDNLFANITNKMINGFDSIIKDMGYCLFYADVNKIDDLWKNSKQYIPRQFEQNKNQSLQIKYLKSRNELFNLKVDIPPIIVIDKNIEFMNGSKHFANLRDLGRKCIPVISYVDCAKDFYKIINGNNFNE